MALTPQLHGGWLLRCRRCDLLQRYPILSTVQYGELYASAADHWPQKQLRPDQWMVQRHIKALLPAGGAVLDVGCAGGALLLSLDDSIAKFGIEPSSEAGRKAALKGIEVLGRSVDDLVGSTSRFDIITAVDVIEHVAHPLVFLRDLALLLKPGGQIVISTGNSRSPIWHAVGPSYYYSHYFEHITFISPAWCAYIEREGFACALINGGFRHEADVGRVRRGRRMPVFAAKWLLSVLERWIGMRLPGVTRDLGPRLNVGEPGLFRDHLMVSIRPVRQR